MTKLIQRSTCPVTGVRVYIPLVKRLDIIALCIHQNTIEARVFLNKHFKS